MNPSSSFDPRLSEQALNESRERLELAMSVVNDGIWDWNISTGNVIYDDRYYNMAGYGRGEFPGLYDEWKKRVHPDDIDRVEELQAKALAGRGPSYKAEFRFKKKDKTWIWIMARGKVVARDKQGRPTRFMGIHSDITELKQTEKALRRAQKMEALGQLTGGIAHDFNNILGIIIGNLDLLEMENKADKRVCKRTTTARKAALRAADITRQLLDFSRSQAEHQVVTNINLLVQGMDRLIKRSLTPEIEVTYHLEKDLWLTRIDPEDLEDALLNLVVNARDFMPGNGRLTIETSNTRLDDASCVAIAGASPGQYVQLTIIDSGPGIPAEHLDRIFDPFFTTKFQGAGSGLGLSTVFGFIRRSKGYIKAFSEPGCGTGFSLFLPRAKADGLQPGVDQESAQPLTGDALAQVKEEDFFDEQENVLTPIKWSNAFYTGIEAVDDDHRVFLALFNRSARVVERGEQNLSAILDELQEYTLAHFGREELIMEVCGFPYLENHRKVHSQLARAVGEQREKFNQDKLTALELTGFLGRWLIDHIQNMDRSIGPFAKDKTLLIQQALAKLGHSLRRKNG